MASKTEKRPCYRVSGYTGVGAGMILHRFPVRANNQKEAMSIVRYGHHGQKIERIHGERIRSLVAARCASDDGQPQGCGCK